MVEGKLKSGVKFMAAALPGTNAPPKVDNNGVGFLQDRGSTVTSLSQFLMPDPM